MVVKSQLKYIRSLQQKKYRNLHKCFVAEGFKTVTELLESGCKPDVLLTTEDRLSQTLGIPAEVISDREMGQVSAFKNPNKILGVFQMPEPEEVNFSDWVLVLDRVRDPGNLGTIIRLCDWFGISHLVCSPDSVDVYNPKVLQATMGSIARVNIVHRELEDFLLSAPTMVFGAFMDGDSVYETKLPQSGILVMGNEAHGISEELGRSIQKKITIPQFGTPSAESLNVAMATAILLNEIRKP